MANTKQKTEVKEPVANTEDPEFFNEGNKEEKQPEGHVSGATMKCWNCANQGTKSRLNQDGICETCGFDVKLVYNGDIEADKAARRVELARQAERDARG